MPTVRSQQIAIILPSARAGVRAARLRVPYADDAIQETLVALIPHLERLSAMPKDEARAYTYVTASRIAMAIRKRLGASHGRASDDELVAWDNAAARVVDSPERILQILQSAERAERVVDRFPSRDKGIVDAVVDEGLSEPAAARALGMSRGNLAYRLRLAREAIGRAWVGTTSWARGRSK